jgi:hypothetical protein
MKFRVTELRRPTYAAAALMFVIAVALPSLLTAKAHAFPTGGQVQSRAIYMSSSVAGATSTTYLVTFKPANTNSLKGVILDFCAGDPIVGDSTCAAPTAFTVGTPTVTFSNTTSGTNAPVTSTALPGTWTPTSLNSGRTLKLTAAAGSGALTTSTLYNFAITTVTNPSTTGSLYARLITYTSDTGDIASYAPGTEGSTDALDYGGFALSTAAVVNITAKVQESLTFCVYKASCSDDPSFTIGHSVGSATVIDSSAVDTATTNFSISTNAQSGVKVRLKGDTLKSGANSINPAGAAAVTFAAGTEDFGVRVSTSGTNITASTPYDGGSGTQYGLDTSTAGENITSLYGDQLASLSAPTNGSISILTWAATASNVTKAGTYTAAEQLIATGTF